MTREIHALLRRMKMLNNFFEEKRNRQLVKYNLTAAQMDVILYLKRNEGKEIHQREIERSFGLKNPTVTGILNRLEEKGLIVRRTNKSDKRFRVIELTEKSSCMMEEICMEARQIDQWVGGCMTEEEEQKLMELLDRILHSLRES